jgi:hypothetical protein
MQDEFSQFENAGVVNKTLIALKMYKEEESNYFLRGVTTNLFSTNSKHK